MDLTFFVRIKYLSWAGFSSLFAVLAETSKRALKWLLHEGIDFSFMLWCLVSIQFDAISTFNVCNIQSYVFCVEPHVVRVAVLPSPVHSWTVLLRIIAKKWKDKEISLRSWIEEWQLKEWKLKQNPFIYLCSRSKWKNRVSFFHKVVQKQFCKVVSEKGVCFFFPAFSMRASLDFWREKKKAFFFSIWGILKEGYLYIHSVSALHWEQKCELSMPYATELGPCLLS